MGEIKKYNSYTVGKLSDGSTKIYSCVKKYKVNNKYKIADDTKEQIIKKYNEGVPMARISRDTGITIGRISRLIKKNKQQNEVKN